MIENKMLISMNLMDNLKYKMIYYYGLIYIKKIIERFMI